MFIMREKQEYIQKIKKEMKLIKNEINYELPEVPKLSDRKKVMFNRDEKIYDKIINILLKLIVNSYKQCYNCNEFDDLIYI